MNDRKFAKGPGPVPDRWLRCPRKANGLVGDKFLAFKTPLSEKFNDQVPVEHRFYPQMMLDSMKSYNVKIGLWIDLTNTNRFYDQSVVENNECKYLKFHCRGHGVTPSQEQTDTFIKVCSNFKNHSPMDLIAVHCTHGFNRTGFLIVAYLVYYEDWSIDAAIKAFSDARPPGIYKQDYLMELFNRYGDVADCPPAPAMPEWSIELDDGSVDDEKNLLSTFEPSIDPEEGSSQSGRRRKEYIKKNPQFMEGVDGIKPIITQPKLLQIQRKVQDMCGWKSSGFPGCQPVSMDMANMHLLHDAPYQVSWKADGTRYLMLVDGENEIYFIDRDNSVFQVKGLRFPFRKDLNKHIYDTLLDGEMVIDKVDGQSFPRYLVYDIIRFQGQEVGKTNFTTRFLCIEKEIVGARTHAMQNGKLDKSLEPFSIRKKEFWDVTQAKSLLGDKFRKNLSHEPDGLIFQPVLLPYVAGKDENVLKWKPVSMNSVDFRLMIVKEDRPGMLQKSKGLLFVGGMDTNFGEIDITKAMKHLNNKIIECKTENGKWIFMRERTDKSFPNAFSTAAAVCQSIRSPVTEEKLLHFIEKYRWHKRRMEEDDRDISPAKVPRR